MIQLNEVHFLYVKRVKIKLKDKPKHNKEMEWDEIP